VVKDVATYHFELTNPEDDPNCANVPSLFRRTADAIADLGEVYVSDMVLDEFSTAKGYLPSIEVYYTRQKRPLRPCVGKLQDGSVGSGGAEVQTNAEPSFNSGESNQHRLPQEAERSFSLSNAFAETDVGNVPKLLRRIADLVDELGDVKVDDMVLDFKEYTNASIPYITIYSSRPDPVETQPRPEGGAEGHAHDAGAEKYTPDVMRPARETETESQEQTIHHFTLKDQRNQPGYLSRPRLLRQTANAIEELGEIEVHHLVLHQELTDGKWVPEHVSFVTVYYNRPESSGLITNHQDDGAIGNSASADINTTHAYVGDHIDPKMAEDLRNRSFRLHNSSTESGYRSVPKLLRRTADAVDALPKVEIDDLILHTEMTPAGRVPIIAVYYFRPSSSDKKFRKEWKQLAQYEKRRAKKNKQRKDARDQ
jgi:hypothetical protein